MARGLKNNNAGNIRKSSDKWLGLSPVQNDADFFQFTAPEYGIRAMVKILRNYQDKYGLDTIAQIIGRWSPPSENDTQAYIDSVSKSVGVPADQPIEVNAYMPQLVSAIITHENGQQPYSDQTIQAGINLA